jgi:RNA polymerase sigma-70 factor (ECF subfamily)
MHETPDDHLQRTLALSARAGSVASYEQLVRQLQVPVMNFLLKRLPSRADAEDVLQETFVRAYQKLALYDDAWPFRGWVFTIACRVAARVAGKPRLAHATPSENAPATDPGPDALAEQHERRDALWSIARRTLSDDEFTALWLHYVEQMPLERVAAALERTPGAVKTMVHRARRRLEPEVRHLAPPPAPPRPPALKIPAGSQT